MKDLQIFKNKKFGEMRTTQIDNTPYVCLADVCKILEIKNISDCKDRLNKDGVVISEVIDKLGKQHLLTKVTYIK